MWRRDLKGPLISLTPRFSLAQRARRPATRATSLTSNSAQTPKGEMNRDEREYSWKVGLGSKSVVKVCKHSLWLEPSGACYSRLSGIHSPLSHLCLAVYFLLLPHCHLLFLMFSQLALAKTAWTATTEKYKALMAEDKVWIVILWSVGRWMFVYTIRCEIESDRGEKRIRGEDYWVFWIEQP